MSELNYTPNELRYDLMAPRPRVHNDVYEEDSFIYDEPIFKNHDEDESTKDLTDSRMARVAGMFIFE